MKMALKALAATLLFATMAFSQPRTWTTSLEFETCGCDIAYVEVFLPGEEEPVLAIAKRFVVQWTFTPEGKTANVQDVLRQMTQRGYYEYHVRLLVGASKVASTKVFWLTPFGVAEKNPGPVPEGTSVTEWGAWFERHQWGRQDWGKEFEKLWWKGSGSVAFTLILRSQYCLEKGEPSE